jgi:hypothetical protein
MRLFLAICVFGFSVVTQAVPKVGDKVHFKGTSSGGVDRSTTVLDKEVVSYDATTQKFLVRTTTIMDGITTTKDEQNLASEILSHESVAEIISNCTAKGGTPGNVQFFGHNYDFCYLSKEKDGCNLEDIIADVPFGKISYARLCDSRGSFSFPDSAQFGGEFSFEWGK